MQVGQKSGDDDALATDLAGELARIIDAAIGTLFDPRCLMILTERVFADDRASLRQIGRDLGLTSERVRQLEAHTRQILCDAIAANPLTAAAAKTVRDFGGLAHPLADVIARMPALAGDVPAVHQPAWRVLERLDGTIEVDGSWCVRPSVREAVRFTKRTLSTMADEYGVVPLGAVDLVSVDDAAHLPQARERWLRHCGILVNDAFALTRTNSVEDYAAAVLSIAGEPLSSQEIIDNFAYKRNDRSLRNKLSADGRFDKVDRDRWALHDWGLEVYSGIRAEIGECLDRCGGSMRLADLADELTRTFSVTHNSVVAYASSPPYQCTNGVVSRAPADKGASKTPERTARLYRVADGWVYRIRVTTDHLRGSGSAAPVAVASIIGLQFGQSRRMNSALGPQSVYWTSIQPCFGTIRRFLLNDGIAADAEVLLHLGDDGTFAFSAVRPATGDPLADALSLVGGPPAGDAETATRVLARAIGLPESASRAALIAGYEQRGDADVAELLIEAGDA